MPHSVHEDIVSIHIGKITGPGMHESLGVRGTGFIISNYLMVTCAHCLDVELKDDEVLMATTPVDGKEKVFYLEKITLHQDGLDIAAASIGLPVRYGLKIDLSPILAGEGVYSYGYPLSKKERHFDQSVTVDTWGRYIQGYVTMLFENKTPPRGYSPAPTLELDMKAPEGLSGAPLCEIHTRAHVIGMVYGSGSSFTTVERDTLVTETGEVQVEVRAYENFAYAHPIKSILSLCGEATREKTIETILSEKPWEEM
jgi:Trypsin-like peptidase domain